MYILFDIGGTNTRIGVSSDGSTVDRFIKIPTNHNFEEMMVGISNVVQELTRGEKILGAAGGSVGPLNDDRSMIINAPNLPEWNHKPLKESLATIFGISPTIENDCVMAGLGEAAYGAGKGHSIVVYMTISTGVGGACIIDGTPNKNRFGFEPGQQIIVSPSKTLEQLVSGTAIEKIHGKKAKDITDPAIWNEVITNLATGLHNTIVHWSPDIVILGGSVMQKISIDLLRQKVKEVSTIFPTLPLLEKVSLEEPALWGALALIKKLKL